MGHVQNPLPIKIHPVKFTNRILIKGLGVRLTIKTKKENTKNINNRLINKKNKCGGFDSIPVQ